MARSERFCQRHYRWLAVLTLALAAFNLGFRLNREVVTAWDESLYATTAAEMVASGNWLVTTFHGAVDYYNGKPPLNVWLIAASFKLFGVNLLALRLPSVIAAWLTILVLQWWCRRCFGAAAAILVGVILSTMFAFLYVHSGRSGNPDSLFTLVVLLTVVTLWSAREHPRRLAWVGPLAAAAFMLKGTGVLMPLLVVVVVVAWRGIGRREVAALANAALLFAIPVLSWAIPRWRFDGWRFFDTLFAYDFVASTTRALEGHSGTPAYYLNVLQKDHYDWLAAAVVLLIVFAVARSHGVRMRPRPLDHDLLVLFGAWAGVTLLVPTAMATKLAWYLNPFYPAFAATVAILFAIAFEHLEYLQRRWQRVTTVAVVLLAFGVAEGKLVWYSYHKRDLRGSVQGALLSQAGQLEGKRVVSSAWDPADWFVLEHMAHGVPVVGDAQMAGTERPATDLLVLTSGDTRWEIVPASVSAPER